MDNNTPPVPLTVEGSSVLHQMFHVDWLAWRSCGGTRQKEILSEAAQVLEEIENGGSAAYAVIGHKSDLMFVHFRDSFDALHEAELRISRLQLSKFLKVASSYLSVVELGLYESSQKTYANLAERNLAPHSPEWEAEIEDTLQRQREAMRSRLFPQIPDSPYICFYPMDRLRGESKNWYQVPMAERARMMHEHGMIGRRYAGTVRQIISGSIGFDDWEWGVDLFAEDPLVFKRLIYEMRFDEVSAVYALFGSFFIGKRHRPASLPSYFSN